MPRVLITPTLLHEKPGPHVDILTKGGFDVFYPPSGGLTQETTQEELLDLLDGTSATLASGELYSPEVLATAKDLRVVARVGVGYDRVNVPAATEHNVAVTITPNANHECVAEHAFGLMLDIARTITVKDREMRQGIWNAELMQPVRERTLGIVGLGRIGRSMAIRALAFRMKVIACETYPDKDFVAKHGIELVSLDDLLARSDYISLHAPHTKETEGMINADTIAKMKKGVYFINTARGGLVVEKDLVPALQSGHIAAAGLDVFEQEPTPADNPLLKLDNVVAMPHIGGADTKSMQDMANEAAQNIVDLHEGRWPKGAVINDTLRETWSW